MKSRFDLEQKILDCWNITDDLQLLVEQNELTQEELLELIGSLKSLYELKFKSLFNTFEECIKDKVFL
jgi:hypothetical protein